MEAGKLGGVQKEAVNLMKNGIYNMLGQLGIYEKQLGQNPEFVSLNKQAYVKSEHKGMFFSDLVAGDKVVKGDVIGMIRNEFGDVQVELTAPASGIILYKVGTPPINIRETIMCIAYKL